MTKRNEIYKCSVCGNMVSVIHEGAGTLVCCGQDMKLMSENTEDAATEKHVPVITKTETGVSVRIGEVDHPMEESHYIEWIELLTKNGSLFHFLEPGEEPVAEFCVDESAVISAREYCNLHGLWKKEN